MNLLSSVITYVRRIIKSPSNQSITDDLIIDYINRFWMMDVDARMQHFDLKTKYSFQTVPTVDQYNMPLYDVQGGGVNDYSGPVGMYPVYQGFTSPAYINGIQVPLQTQKNSFFKIWPNVVQNLQVVGTSNGTIGPYNLQIPILPNNNTIPQNPPLQGILRGHVDITGIIATGVNQDPPFGTTLNMKIPSTSIQPAVFITTIDQFGNNIVVTDSGQFLEDGGNNLANYGLLMAPGTAPFGYSTLLGGYSTTQNTVNYLTGEINVTLPATPAAGQNISVQCFYFQSGLPRAILFYNNTLTLRSPPDRQYLVEIDAYLSPSAFLNSASAIPFGYMAEYIARGAARKILSDTGDIEQFQFYESLFREQELLVWKRSQRQWTNNRTETIYSNGMGSAISGSGFGGGTI